MMIQLERAARSHLPLRQSFASASDSRAQWYPTVQTFHLKPMSVSNTRPSAPCFLAATWSGWRMIMPLKSRAYTPSTLPLRLAISLQRLLLLRPIGCHLSNLAVSPGRLRSIHLQTYPFSSPLTLFSLRMPIVPLPPFLARVHLLWSTSRQPLYSFC